MDASLQDIEARAAVLGLTLQGAARLTAPPINPATISRWKRGGGPSARLLNQIDGALACEAARQLAFLPEETARRCAAIRAAFPDLERMQDEDAGRAGGQAQEEPGAQGPEAVHDAVSDTDAPDGGSREAA